MKGAALAMFKPPAEAAVIEGEVTANGEQGAE